MLSALPAARRATGEIDDINSKVVQMHQDGAALRVCVRVEVKCSRSLSVFLSVCDYYRLLLTSLRRRVSL